MATLTPSFNLRTDSTFKDDLDFSINGKAFTVNGDSLVRTFELSTTSKKIFDSTSFTGKCYLAVINKNQSANVKIDDASGGNNIFSLAGSEFLFVPWSNSYDLWASTDTEGSFIEVYVFEVGS